MPKGIGYGGRFEKMRNQVAASRNKGQRGEEMSGLRKAIADRAGSGSSSSRTKKHLAAASRKLDRMSGSSSKKIGMKPAEKGGQAKLQGFKSRIEDKKSRY